MNRIGLFPLGIVLFPNASYPLFIFESRYKKLINKCWDQQVPFGINLMLPKKLSEVGCLTVVSDVMKVREDGDMEILVTGRNRFKIVQIYDGVNDYLEADIESYEDIDSSFDPNLLENVLDIFNQIAKKVKKFKIQEIHFDNLEFGMPSFTIALKSGLSLEEKQRLLESRYENERLEMLNKHLKFLFPLIDKAEGLETLAKNDGYFSL